MTTQSQPSFPDLLSLIQSTWGFRELRPLQAPAMQAMLDRRDSLVVLPTGGGKSLCYQAPAYYLSQLGLGPTVVISPLIALMKDQVDSLRSLGVPAAQIDSSLSPDERQVVANDLRLGQIHMLFVSPEKLIGSGESFRDMLRDSGVKTFAIDEAHCISHWGHDFRPEYRQLANLKEMFPGATVHAFTATATKHVRDDIARQLNLEDPELLVGNFDRPNLTYRILPRRDIFKQIEEILARHKDEAGIIYCMRRKDVDEIAATLNATKSLGRKAVGYHAGMTPQQRTKAQNAFIDEECDLIVATIAFGMGIDRSNIRFILHTAMPKSIEAYQQETGRAGRDGLEAECVLLHSGSDAVSWKSLIEKSASEAGAAGTTVDPDFVNSACKHIDDMDRFARNATCRHKALVEYFGQQYIPPAASKPLEEDESRTPDPGPRANEPPSCNACDHCLGDTTSVEGAQVIAQKILSAVARTEQRFGAGHIISVLRGENTQRIRDLKHDQLSTYGLLGSYDQKALRDFIYQLIGQGVLAQENLILSDGRGVPIIKLNKFSVEVMKGSRPVRLVQITRRDRGKDKASSGEAASWEGVDHALFDALRALRKQIATERGIPPYVVFSDNTLRELARVRPATPQQFRLIYGVGQRKFDDLAPKFLPFIVDYCKAKNLGTNVTSVAPKSTTQPESSGELTLSRWEAFTMFRRGASIDEVSEQISRARSTVTQYLVEYIAAEKPESIQAWVPANVVTQVLGAIKKVGPDKLKPIFVELGESVPYDQVRLVAVHARST